MNLFFWRSHRDMLPLPYRREMHCHVLPGLDDGAQTMRVSESCIKSLLSMGVERIVCTPHHNTKYPNAMDEAYSVFEEVKVNNPALEEMSFEYRLDDSVNEVKAFLPIAGRYVLIEDGLTQHYTCLEEVAQKVTQQGFIPVLAHPERYPDLVMQGMMECDYLRSQGILFQCNMLSFAGFYSEGAKRFVYKLLDRGMIDFMGSDMHNERYARALIEFLKTEEYEEIREPLQAMIMNDKV